MLLARTMEDWFRLARPRGLDSALLDDCTLLLHDDKHRVRLDIRVKRSIKDHALHTCRKVSSGYDGTGALVPFRRKSARIVL